MVDANNVTVTPTNAPTVSGSIRQRARTMTVFHCPCCAIPSLNFDVTIEDGIGIAFSMTCPTCLTPVEALIRTSVAPTIGLA